MFSVSFLTYYKKSNYKFCYIFSEAPIGRYGPSSIVPGCNKMTFHETVLIGRAPQIKSNEDLPTLPLLLGVSQYSQILS